MKHLVVGLIAGGLWLAVALVIDMRHDPGYLAGCTLVIGAIGGLTAKHEAKNRCKKLRPRR